MNGEELTLEELSLAACTADSSRPHLREAAQAYLDRIGFKPLADQWTELERERDDARAEVDRLKKQVCPWCEEEISRRQEGDEFPDNVCRECGKPTECIYCSAEGAAKHPCPHGNPPGQCDHCDHAADLAFDAAREGRSR